MEDFSGLSDDLVSCLEDMVGVLRQLPTDPSLSLNAALVVRRCVADGPTRVSVLAQQLGVSQPAATQIVDRLAADGWVERMPDPKDQRAVRIAATQQGRRRFAKRHASRVQSLAVGLEQLSRPQRTQLRAAVPALHDLLSHLTNSSSRGAA